MADSRLQRLDCVARIGTDSALGLLESDWQIYLRANASLELQHGMDRLED